MTLGELGISKLRHVLHNVKPRSGRSGTLSANCKAVDGVVEDRGGSNEVTLAYWKENREQLRQSESQRAFLTNYILVIVAAVSGFIVQQHFAPRTFPLCVMLIVIGLYGALATAKYHERAEYHLSQARALTRSLIDAGVLADHQAVLNDYRQTHYARYPRLHRVRLHHLWTGLHFGVAVYGVTLMIIVLVVWK